MKFSINLSGKTLYSFMRECGYAPQEKLVFHRFLVGRRYPKFHIYASVSANPSDGEVNKKTAVLNLHLDQKQSSYKGSHAHSAEYDGPVVEAEVARIRSFYH